MRQDHLYNLMHIFSHSKIEEVAPTSGWRLPSMILLVCVLQVLFPVQAAEQKHYFKYWKGGSLVEIQVDEHFERLGLEPTASLKEIKKAYRKKAMKTHPDRFPNDREKKAEEFKKLQTSLDIAKAYCKAPYYMKRQGSRAHPHASHSSYSYGNGQHKYSNGYGDTETDVEDLLKELLKCLAGEVLKTLFGGKYRDLFEDLYSKLNKEEDDEHQEEENEEESPNFQKLFQEIKRGISFARQKLDSLNQSSNGALLSEDCERTLNSLEKTYNKLASQTRCKREAVDELKRKVVNLQKILIKRNRAFQELKETHNTFSKKVENLIQDLPYLDRLAFECSEIHRIFLASKDATKSALATIYGNELQEVKEMHSYYSEVPSRKRIYRSSYSKEYNKLLSVRDNLLKFDKAYLRFRSGVDRTDQECQKLEYLDEFNKALLSLQEEAKRNLLWAYKGELERIEQAIPFCMPNPRQNLLKPIYQAFLDAKNGLVTATKEYNEYNQMLNTSLEKAKNAIYTQKDFPKNKVEELDLNFGEIEEKCKTQLADIYREQLANAKERTLAKEENDDYADKYRSLYEEAEEQIEKLRQKNDLTFLEMKRLGIVILVVLTVARIVYTAFPSLKEIKAQKSKNVSQDEEEEVEDVVDFIDLREKEVRKQQEKKTPSHRSAESYLRV